MLMIYQCIQVFIWLILAPTVIGFGIQKWAEKSVRVPYAFMYGTVFGWATFELLCVPSIMLQVAFHYVVVMWCLVQTGMVIGIIYCNRACLRQTGSIRQQIENKIKRRTGVEIALVLLTCLIICGQMGMYVFGTHRDDDDARYVANAVAAVTNDKMLLTNPYTGEILDAPVGELLKECVAPWTMYIATLSKITQIHPATMSHTVLPPVLLLLAYIAYLILADSLFALDEYKKKIVFLFLVSVFVMFAAVSRYTATSFFLTRIWQGKSVVAAVMIPLIYGYLPRFLEHPAAYRQYVVLLLINGASCLLSGVGIVVSGLLVGALLFTYTIQTKKCAILIWGIVSCVPNLITGLLYVSV